MSYREAVVVCLTCGDQSPAMTDDQDLLDWQEDHYEDTTDGETLGHTRFTKNYIGRQLVLDPVKDSRVAGFNIGDSVRSTRDVNGVARPGVFKITGFEILGDQGIVAKLDNTDMAEYLSNLEALDPAD